MHIAGRIRRAVQYILIQQGHQRGVGYVRSVQAAEFVRADEMSGYLNQAHAVIHVVDPPTQAWQVRHAIECCLIQPVRLAGRAADIECDRTVGKLKSLRAGDGHGTAGADVVGDGKAAVAGGNGVIDTIAGEGGGCRCRCCCFRGRLRRSCRRRRVAVGGDISAATTGQCKKSCRHDERKSAFCCHFSLPELTITSGDAVRVNASVTP